MQLKFVSKEEAHKLIDIIPSNTVMIIQYNGVLGISDYGRYIKKRKGKKYVDRSSVVVLAKGNPVTTLNLHDKFFNSFNNYDKENTMKSILLPKME